MVRIERMRGGTEDMAQPIVLDALYPEMEEATIGRWLLAAGDEVVEGQPIVELITDKVVYEYQSPATGCLLALLPTEKSVIPVGTTLAILGFAGEDAGDLQPYLQENHRLAEAREANITAILEATGSEMPSASSAMNTGGNVRATPAARRLARERGIDLASLQGSGPGGMITVDDLP